MKIIVGLGNPGKEYEKTRHNTGEFILSRLNLNNKKVRLIFPNEFMNNSGAGLKKELAKLKLKIKPADILVIHDDLDIEFGKIKLSFGKSSAGHKGVESVIKMLKTDKFWRLRVGIGVNKKPLPRAESRGDHKKMVDFILKKFSPAEEKILNKNFKKISQGLETWLTHPDKAMSMINSSK
jgi:PTH1 family peptidyl-tRNA hydrolase